MLKGTDSPEVTMVALMIVEAISLRDEPRLRSVLGKAAAEQDMITVMLSLGNLAEGLLRMLPDWEERLQEWMVATEIDTLSVGAE